MNEKPIPEMKLTDAERQLLRAWSTAPAPSEERLTQLTATLPLQATRRPRRRIMRTLAQHLATGALLFIAGYFLGQTGQAARNTPAVPIADSASHPPTPQHASGQTPPPPTPIPPAATTIANATIPQPASQSPDCKAPQVYQGKDGQFRIDAVLCETGSRATWVINPNLELASAPQSETETKQ